MTKNFDLRTSLLAKCAAVLLLLACLTGALAGTAAVSVRSIGYGAYNTFEEDPLCTEYMEGAAVAALYYTVRNHEYYASDLENRYAGYSAQIYQGETLVASWSAVPDHYLVKHTMDFPHFEETETGEPIEYTVIGYLHTNLPIGSVFLRNLNVYNLLHSLSYGATVVLTILFYTACAALLIYLLWSCGHHPHVEGIALNWQDRIPIDLYLLCSSTLFVLSMSMIDRFYHWNRTSFLSAYLIPVALSLSAAAVIALATLLTMATRLKRGRWWRNSVCWFLASSCWRLWKRCWHALMEFARILPLTWRTVLAVGGLLLVQTLLTVFVMTTWDGFIFFLLMAVMDAVLVVGAAWLTRQLQQVKDMGHALAAGDLEAKLDTRKMFWDVKNHAESLNAIGVGMNRAVEQRMKSEHLKTELITNVSHDIKTPLTSIVNYVDLLKKEDLPPAAAEYTAVLDRQSKKLKKLTEDLVEASKASTGNIAVSLEAIVVNEIMHQAIGDYDERLAAGKLEVVLNTYEGNLMALADGRLLWRVLDNLLSNVCKYALAGTRVYVDLGERAGRVFLTVKNISRDPLNVTADELMERFVRGDTSRHTEGSGLGLNIARSLMELMGGTFALSVDGDLFKAELTLQAA